MMMTLFASRICEALVDDFPIKILFFWYTSLMLLRLGGCRFKFFSNLTVPGFLVISQACFCLLVELTVFIAEGWFNCLPLSYEIS